MWCWWVGVVVGMSVVLVGGCSGGNECGVGGWV